MSTPPTPECALAIDRIDVHYGRLQALRNLSLQVQAGEAVGLLGANGAGKTTLLNTLSGFLHPSAGRIEFFGRSIGTLSAHRVVKRGLLHVSQSRDLFGDLTVMDNLRLGALTRPGDRFEPNLDRVFGFFPRLKERVHQRASTMSGGEQQMLAIGRGLMTNPDCLIMDEPSEGLAPIIIQGVWEAIGKLKKEGMSILLDRKSTRLNSSHIPLSRMPSSA